MVRRSRRLTDAEFRASRHRCGAQRRYALRHTQSWQDPIDRKVIDRGTRDDAPASSIPTLAAILDSVLISWERLPPMRLTSIYRDSGVRRQHPRPGLSNPITSLISTGRHQMIFGCLSFSVTAQPFRHTPISSSITPQRTQLPCGQSNCPINVSSATGVHSAAEIAYHDGFSSRVSLYLRAGGDHARIRRPTTWIPNDEASPDILLRRHSRRCKKMCRRTTTPYRRAITISGGRSRAPASPTMTAT